MSILNDIVTEAMIQNCQTDLNDWGGIKMSPEQIRDMISDQTDFVATLLTYYKDEDTFGLDTQDRDTLFDIVAIKILGRTHWPLNMENDASSLADDIRRAVLQGHIEAFSE